MLTTMTKLKTAQRVEGALARAAFGLPSSWVRRLAGGAIERQGRTLDAQVQLLLRMNRLAGNKPFHELGLRRARRATEISSAQMTGKLPPLQRVEEATLGARPVRIYRPLNAEQAGPALLFFHGGGFVVGSLDSHDTPCRELAARTPCTVIAVDYRLAPEHPFPAAVDDAATVFRAAVADAARFDIDPKRIAIAGDSAGGNIAAVLAIDTRHDEVKPFFQLLVYPAVDMTMSFPSIEQFGDGFYLERESMLWFLKAYLDGADPKDLRASPLLVDDHSGLPPALVITAGFDPLRDEGDAYAKRLREAGVRVAHHQHPQLFHGFWNTTTVIREARRAFDEAVGVLRAEFSSGR